MDDKLFKLALELVVYLLPFLAAFLVKFVVSKIGTERIIKIRQEFDIKYAWAWDVVLAVERKYWQEVGSFKKQKAVEALVAKANKYKVPITEKEVDTLIEAAVEAMKNQFITLTTAEGTTAEDEQEEAG